MVDLNLICNNGEVTDERLKTMTQLTALHLESVESISNESVQYLVNLKYLETYLKTQ